MGPGLSCWLAPPQPLLQGLVRVGAIGEGLVENKVEQVAVPPTF